MVDTNPPIATTTAKRLDGNLLLKMLPPELHNPIVEAGEIVELSAGHALFSSGDHIDYTYFPLEQLMISMLVSVDDDRQVEVGTIGQEGAIGGIVSCGNLPAFTRAEVQVAGQCCRVPMEMIERMKSESRVVRDMFCRYADALLAQVMQSVACTSFHAIERRAARWLLTAQDRAGDQLQLTQGALAALLGVQRTSVNAVARDLQDKGLISYRRGVIQVLDREGLEAHACDCYSIVSRHFDRVIGEKSQWIESCAG